MVGQSTPRGVEIHGKSVRINFQWLGKTRKVNVPGLEPTPDGIRQAGAIREIIKSEIKLGTFRWSNHFPDHKLAKAELPDQQHFTVEELLNGWLKDQKSTLAPNYYSNSTYRVESILIPAFGHIPMSMLTPGHIRRWAKTLNVARKTISNYIAPLKSAIREAMADSILTEDPLAGLVLPKEKTAVTKRIEEQREEVDPYNKDEIAKLLDGCHWESERNIFEFAVWSGVRPGELIALEWRHVDLKKGVVYIRQAISGREMSDIKTKAKGRREIMLLPGALKALMNQRAVSELLPHGRVFVNRKQKPFRDYNSIYHCFVYACKRAGIKNRGIGQTRHTFASWMLIAGEDEMWVSKMLGHVSVEMVRKHYRKFIKDNSATGYTLKSDWNENQTEPSQETPQNLPKAEVIPIESSVERAVKA